MHTAVLRQQRAVKGDAAALVERAELIDAALVGLHLLGTAAEQQKKQKCVDEQQDHNDDRFEPGGLHACDLLSRVSSV